MFHYSLFLEIFMRILIIDNDLSIRKAVSLGIQKNDWIIDTAEDTINDAITLLGQYQYDIIIANLTMEEEHTINVIREIKQQTPETIVIGMTRGSASEFFSENNMDFFNACYQKPLHLKMLKKVIDLELKKLAAIADDVE